jgi:hypothetical protein
MRRFYCIPLLMAVTLTWCAAAIAPAQVTNSVYSVTHSFVFTVPNALPPIATFNADVAAGAFEPAPGWDVSSNSAFLVVVGGGPPFLLSTAAGTDVPRPGYFDAGAKASASAGVNSWGGGIYSATMTSQGSAHAQFAPNRAYADSSVETRIFAPVSWRNGRIVWRPIIADQVSGSASASGVRQRPVRVRDPILVDGYFPTGATGFTESFFDVFLEVSGDVQWDPGGLQAVDASGSLDLGLKIDMPSLFVTDPGSLVVDVVGGVVTQSSATGRFSGVGLPPVGAVVGGLLTLPGLGGDFDIEYALPDLGVGSEYVFLLGGSGFGETAVPEPATWSLLLLGCAIGSRWLRRSA